MWQSAVSQRLTLLSGKPCPQSSGSFTASYLVLFYTCSRAQHLRSICVIYESQISLCFLKQHASPFRPVVLGVGEQTELQDSTDSTQYKAVIRGNAR